MSTFLEIDRIACDGHGACAEVLPERIALDDWGYPILAPGPLPGSLRELATLAIETCPVRALRLRAESAGRLHR
jgi:ferredoxin